MKNALFLLVFSFFLFSCKPWWAAPLTSDSDSSRGISNVCVEVSKTQEPKVIEAIEAWNISLKNWKKIIPVIGIKEYCDYFIVETKAPEDISHKIMARTSRVGGRNITMYTGRYEIDTFTVTLHELGHAFGAKHMANTLMSPQLVYRYYKCPDAATVAQVATWNNIDPGLLSWCDSTRYVKLQKVWYSLENNHQYFMFESLDERHDECHSENIDMK